MNEARDNPGVIAPPPLIALAALLLGLALDWLSPPFILRGLFGFWTRLVVGGMLIAAGIIMAAPDYDRRENAAVVGFGGSAAAQSQTDCEFKVPPGTTSGAIQQKSGPPLSEEQHSQIKAAIARERPAQARAPLLHLHRTPVPRSVHFVALPDEIVPNRSAVSRLRLLRHIVPVLQLCHCAAAL
jgi:hypothetical protein